MSRKLVVLPAALAALCLLVLAPAAGAGDTIGTVTARDTLEVQVLGELNRIRAQHSLHALRLSRPLAVAADAHSRDMALRGYFDHNGPGGRTFARRIARYYPQGSHRVWGAGENLLWYSPDLDAATAVATWMKSPGHRQNILRRDWREIGLAAVHAASAPGYYDGAEVTILTADFGVRS